MTHRTQKQKRSARVNYLKLRLIGTKSLCRAIISNKDLPEEVKVHASYIHNNIRMMLLDWPKHLPKEE